MPLTCNYFPYRGDVATHQVLCRNIEGSMFHLQGIFRGVMISSDYVMTPKVVLEFFYYTLYVATSNSLCCYTSTSIELARLLMSPTHSQSILAHAYASFDP
ncbi:hypothetical protein PVK06_002806 [Gossypium arboreum]|uniref:Uncharacterized protein n=1 Tax=Gossypium arboreum TaxID=29729 RepID=A0ABR0R4T0_GOSAR|nr:hypothetical protein PVK06_002806 [Gossypium arboreum]